MNRERSIKNTEHHVVPEILESKPVITIDVSSAWDTASYWEIIKPELQKQGLLDEERIYRGFNTDSIDMVLKNGIDKPLDKENPTDDKDYDSLGDFIWASDEEDIISNEDGNAIEYAFYNDNKAGLLVFDANMLESARLSYTYTPKKGTTYMDALIAVVKLKD